MVQEKVWKFELCHHRQHHTTFTKFCITVQCTAVLVLHWKCKGTSAQTAAQVSSTGYNLGKACTHTHRNATPCTYRQTSTHTHTHAHWREGRDGHLHSPSPLQLSACKCSAIHVNCAWFLKLEQLEKATCEGKTTVPHNHVALQDASSFLQQWGMWPLPLYASLPEASLSILYTCHLFSSASIYTSQDLKQSWLMLHTRW